MRTAVACILALALAPLAPGAANAQAPHGDDEETLETIREKADSLFVTTFTIDDANPSKSVPTQAQRAAAPLEFATFLMELGERAERATQRNDHVAAARYYKAVVVAAPDRALPFVQLCRAYEAAGELDNARSACGAALTRPGVTGEDFAYYVHLVLAQPGQISGAHIKDLDALMAHLRTALPQSAIPAQLRCDIGVRLLDVARLRECTAALAKQLPGDPRTVGYQWALALQLRDYEALRSLAAQATRSGMHPDVANAMQVAAGSASAPWPRLRDALVENPARTVALTAFGLALFIAAVLIRRQRQPTISATAFQESNTTVTGVERT